MAFYQPPLVSDGPYIANWLKTNFIASFEREVRPNHWSTEKDEGAFAITLLCLVHVAALAGFVAGTSDATSVVCVNFINKWFGDVPISGARYQKRAAALYSLFRHGLIHQWTPGRLALADGKSLGWAVSRDVNRSHHMCMVPGRMLSIASGEPVHFHLVMYADLLFEDCLSIFNAVCSKCLTDPLLAKNIYAGIQMASAPRVVESKTIQRMIPASVADPDDRWPDFPDW